MIKTVLAAVALATVATAAFAQTAPAPAPDHAGHAMSAPASAAALPTVASPIKDLLANPATAAVMEKHLPGVAQHPMLPQFQDMTLSDVAPMSGGAISPATIQAIDTDIKALPHS
jgi:hypothetical protein